MPRSFTKCSFPACPSLCYQSSLCGVFSLGKLGCCCSPAPFNSLQVLKAGRETHKMGSCHLTPTSQHCLARLQGCVMVSLPLLNCTGQTQRGKLTFETQTMFSGARQDHTRSGSYITSQGIPVQMVPMEVVAACCDT